MDSFLHVQHSRNGPLADNFTAAAAMLQIFSKDSCRPEQDLCRSFSEGPGLHCPSPLKTRGFRVWLLRCRKCPVTESFPFGEFGFIILRTGR